MKRDIQEEILAIQARHRYAGRSQYSERLRAIEKTMKELTENPSNTSEEFLKYIPIATVACIQGFFRYAIKEIVDSDKPISKNISNFRNNIKLPDFELIMGIKAKTFTIGELLAHSLSYNSYEDINQSMSLILDNDFTKKLQTQKPSYMLNLDILYSAPWGSISFDKNFGEIKKNIDLTFKMRNVFCHELATNVKIEKRKILRSFYTCKHFLNHSNEIINNSIYSDPPKNIEDACKKSRQSFIIKDKELKKMIAILKKARKKEIKLIGKRHDLSSFNTALDNWNKYRKQYAKSEASLIKDKTLHTMVYYLELEEITNEKIEGLKYRYGRLFEKKQNSEYIFT